jgi:hypothetical protein
VACVGVGCEARNPNARLDFAATVTDMATQSPPLDLQPTGDLAPSGVQLTNGGLLESIAADAQYVAFLPADTRAARQSVGALTVMPLPSGPRIAVAGAAYGAAFAGNDTLFYSVAPALSTDPGSVASYGGLGVWMPSLAAGVTLSRGYAVSRLLASDGSYALWWDVATPTANGTGDLTLGRSADCKGPGCASVTIAAGVTRPSELSGTDSHAAYSIKSGATYDVWLIDVAAGTSAQVISGGTSGAISFSSDGAFLAGVGPRGALQVVATADGSAVPWGALPAGARVRSLDFVDATRIAVRATPAGATSDSAYVATRHAVTPIISGGVGGIFVVRSGAGGTTRWLLASGPLNHAGLGAVSGYDLSAGTATAIPLATSTRPSTIAISSDQLYARVLEAYEPASASGTLTMVKLPGGSRATLDKGVAAATVSATGPHAVMWIGAGGRLSAWRDGVITAYASGVRDFRTRSNTVYFTVDGSDELHGYVPGIWFTTLE